MARKRSLGKLKIRQWGTFFDSSCFSVPNSKTWGERVSSNLVYYQANYICVMCLLLLYVCIARPLFFFAMSAVIGTGYYLFVINNKPIVVNGAPIRRRHMQIGFFSGSMLIFILFGGYQCMMALALTCLVVLIHSSFRKRSLKSRGTNFMHAMTGHATPMQTLLDEAAERGDEGENPSSSSSDEKFMQDQRKFRARFRANMRAKYLPKSG